MTTPTSTFSAGTATTARERISGIDVLRGFALLGILVLNINYFGGPEASHDIPYGGLDGPHGTVNLVTFYIKWFFFEAKMRGLFSMLFGAGVILLTSRAERRGAGGEIADIYVRRNMWLVVLGVLHTVLIWDGDILFDYGFIALLVLYPLRRLSGRTLLISGTFLSAVVATGLGIVYVGTPHHIILQQEAAPILVREQAKQPLSDQDKKTLEEWRKFEDKHRLTPENRQKKIKEFVVDYPHQLESRSEGLTSDFFHDHILLACDSISAMIIGMGLMRVGFLTAELPYLTYLLTALIGFAISIPLYWIGLARVVASKLDYMTIERWLFAPYYFSREAGMLAIAAVLVMVIKSGRLRVAQRLLAAVGQTALTNYLLTSVICQFLFLWGPWKLYGQLDYYQYNYVVLGVWAFNLTFSTLWLRSFAFGPVEWVWRSLTYVRLQPMRLSKTRQSMLPSGPQESAPSLAP
jgi:uncharacterized protein